MDLQNQSDELRALGISVIDQESLEENVETAVDNAVIEHSRKQKLQILKREIKDSIFGLKKLLNKEKEYRFKLSGMKNRLTDPRQYLATEKSLSENTKLINDLRKRRKYLEDKLLAADIDKSELDNFDLELEEGELLEDDNEENSRLSKPSETEKEKLIREGKMTPFGTYLCSESSNGNIESKYSCNSKVGIKHRQTNNSLSSAIDQDARKVCQNLPSGNVDNKKVGDETERKIMNSYLKDQFDRQKSYTGDTKLIKRKPVGKITSSYGVPAKRRKKIKEFIGSFENCSKTTFENETPTKKSPLKLKILHPKKHWKESNLGSITSELEADQRKTPSKPLSESVAFEGSESDGFADSDYVPSEEELLADYNDTKIAVETVAKGHKKEKFLKKDSSKSKQIKKTKDDGNLEDYKFRIKSWNLEKLKLKQERIVSGEDFDSDEEDENDYEEFSGGYRIPLSIWNKLYKYQKTCVRWLWELHCQGCGGILGDEMGLGKTIEVISFLVGISYSKITHFGENWKGLGPVLIVCPTTVLHQWVKEFHKWWPPFRVAILHDSGAFIGKRPALIHNINVNNGILVTSYSGLTKQLKVLLQYNWHYIILDEGHKIRNPEAQITVAVKRFETIHRVILSGSPIQNSLKELWSLFDFVFPGKLGTLPVFLQQFSVPITQGGYANASKLEVQTAFRCATILRDTINPYLLRRMKNDVRSHLSLPDKNEQVLFCGLTEDQRSLYKEYISGNEIQYIMKGRMKVFVGLINLRKICNHPDLFSGGPKHVVGEEISGLQPENTYGYWKRAGKMIVLHAVLKLWHKQGHRILLFTQSRQMMCILEKFIQDEKYSYLKMDGSTGVGSRQPMIEKYNNDSSIFVFLLTTRVGGLGVNLTGADRVIIFDPDWNPSTDTQARERAWRIGQTRQVTIYRFLTAGTIEEKIYHRQIFKQFLTNRVLKDPKQQRFFKSNDLFELFTLNEGEKEKPESVSIFAGIGSEIKIKASKTKMSIEDRPTTSIISKNKNFKSIKNIETTKSVGVELEKADREESKKLDKAESEKSYNKEARSTANVELEKSDTSELAISDVGEIGKPDIDYGKQQNLELVKEYVLETEEEILLMNAPSTVEALSGGSEDKNSIKDLSLESNQENSKRSCEESKFSSDNLAENSLEINVENQADLGSDVSKREKMMQLAKLLSKQIEMNKLSKKEPKVGKKKKKSNSNKKGKKFEGERIEFLVKKRKMKCEDEEEKKTVSKSQDEYVLEKLFKKSGVHTALSHDVIVNSGGSDYLLLESEAERVAKEAMKKVRLSRRFLTSQSGSFKVKNKKPRFGVKSGSFVGQESKAYKQKVKKKLKIDTMFHGGISEEDSSDQEEKVKMDPVKSAHDFGTSELNTEGGENSASGIISSSQLLQRMRERNRGVDQMDETESDTVTTQRGRLNDEEDYDPAYPSTAETEYEHETAIDPDLERHIDLLADIRNFVAFQATSSGCASTDEIVTRFKPRLPPDQSHIFKALLNEICDFGRNSSKQGMWYIKGEFR